MTVTDFLNDYLIVFIVVTIFLTFSIINIRGDNRALKEDKGGLYKIYHILGIIFTIPFLIMSLVMLLIVIISIISRP